MEWWSVKHAIDTCCDKDTFYASDTPTELIGILQNKIHKTNNQIKLWLVLQNQVTPSHSLF